MPKTISAAKAPLNIPAINSFLFFIWTLNIKKNLSVPIGLDC
jgi:hypothetical protein